MAAVPSIGRANRVDRPAAPGADAASELYERYSAQIFGYCFHQLGSREEAEDAVQTTFMNAFRGLARGIVPQAEQAWVFKIAHNVCLSRRRSSWRRGRVEAPNNMEVLQEVVPAKEKAADELIRLQDVLETMPENQRRAILLREWQGLSYREIADELDLSQAAVETLIFRARRALAAGLEETLIELSWRRRLRRGADIGGAAAFLKTLVGGGGASALKVASVVALAGATVATTTADRFHSHRSAHRSATPAKTAAGVGVATTARHFSAASTDAQPSVVALRRDIAPHVVHKSSPRPSHASSPEVAKSSAQSSPAPAPASPAPTVTATEETAASTETAPPPPVHVKAPKSNGRPADAGKPAPTGESSPGNGKGRQKDPPVAPQPAPPAPPAPAAAAPEPEGSGDHGHDTAPGQEKKDDPAPQGNGHGK